MAFTNCWEFKNCGREPGGIKVIELGVCPASIETRVNAMNHGMNGGRACWAINKTICDGKVQGTLAVKLSTCLYKCEFYQKVEREEGSYFQGTKGIAAKLK